MVYLILASSERFLAESVTDQAKQRQRDQFDAEEQRRQMVGIRQQDPAQRGN